MSLKPTHWLFPLPRRAFSRYMHPSAPPSFWPDSHLYCSLVTYTFCATLIACSILFFYRTFNLLIYGSILNSLYIYFIPYSSHQNINISQQGFCLFWLTMHQQHLAPSTKSRHTILIYWNNYSMNKKTKECQTLQQVLYTHLIYFSQWLPELITIAFPVLKIQNVIDRDMASLSKSYNWEKAHRHTVISHLLSFRGHVT